ncbi:MAG: hypothetical protein PHE36_05990 [Novosphingobium sp.]|nr:hypothetical protein [Novosphingobium sp.]
MRKFLFAAPLALAAAATLATPATAESRPQNGVQVRQEIAQLDRQIDRARARHTISVREAARLHGQVDRLENLYARYARNGLTRAELRTLDNRIDRVKRQLHVERSDNNDHRGDDRPQDHGNDRR